jgi:hypothetical protein
MLNRLWDWKIAPIAGYYHHRWFVEIIEDEVLFRQKTHLIYDSWKYRLPRRYVKKLTEEEKVSCLFWSQSFQYREIIQISLLKVTQELENYVKLRQAYPRICYVLDELRSPRSFLVKRIFASFPWIKSAVEWMRGRPVTITSDWEKFWSNIQEISSR